MGKRKRQSSIDGQAPSSAKPGSTPAPSYGHIPPPAAAYTGAMSPPSQPQIQWSTIKSKPASVEKLRLLCHSQNELKKKGYVLKPLDADQIEGKLRCTKCGKRASRKRARNPVPSKSVSQGNQQPSSSKFCDAAAGGCGRPGHASDSCWYLHPELKPRMRGGKKKRDSNIKGNSNSNSKSADYNAERAPGKVSSTAPEPERPKACQYHTGQVRSKYFTCCNRHVSEKGCIEMEEHELPARNDPTNLQYWQFHTTPTSGSTLPPGTHAAAISLDCEMGISRNNEPELIRLTAIDFFTGAILIDNLVAPDVPLAHYNTHYSGVSARHMATAIRNRTAIHGRDRARMGLLEFVGPETVVVVHGGSGDFRALRWIHPLIVDPEILEGYAGPNVVPGEKSLKNLCKVKLGIDVQVRDAANGKLGHDSVEDALATRELAIQWLQSIPDGHGRMGRKKIRVK